jgi:hypothetical protein
VASGTRRRKSALRKSRLLPGVKLKGALASAGALLLSVEKFVHWSRIAPERQVSDPELEPRKVRANWAARVLLSIGSGGPGFMR